MWMIVVYFVWSVGTYGQMHSGGAGFPTEKICKQYAMQYVAHVRNAVSYKCVKIQERSR
jgi:hypothetical protein